MLADDASPVSLRSYAYELLSWFRFLRAVEVPWDLAGRTEARDFALWLKTSKKPHGNAALTRRHRFGEPGHRQGDSWRNYAARTRRHARAVIRSFYEYHREMHGRPLVNPFPKAKGADRRTSQRPPQSDAAVPAAVPAGAVPAEGAQAGPAEHPGSGVQRAVRGAGLQQGSGLDRVLHVHRRPRLGTAGRLPRPRGAPGSR